MRARPGDWDLPGGTIDDHEDISDGILREVFEETALVIVKLEKVTDYTYQHDGVGRAFHYYRANMIAGEPLLSHEHDMFEWHEPLVASTMVTYKPHSLGLKAVSTSGTEA